MKTFLTGLGFSLVLLGATPTFGQTYAEKVELGHAIYTQHCSLCHDNSPHMLNDNGPALFGIVGRRVGFLEGYQYSPALLAAKVRQDTWTSERLDKFLTNPSVMYPGTSMAMNYDDPQVRNAIITYLKTLKPR